MRHRKAWACHVGGITFVATSDFGRRHSALTIRRTTIARCNITNDKLYLKVPVQGHVTRRRELTHAHLRFTDYLLAITVPVGGLSTSLCEYFSGFRIASYPLLGSSERLRITGGASAVLDLPFYTFLVRQSLSDSIPNIYVVPWKAVPVPVSLDAWRPEPNLVSPLILRPSGHRLCDPYSPR